MISEFKWGVTWWTATPKHIFLKCQAGGKSECLCAGNYFHGRTWGGGMLQSPLDHYTSLGPWYRCFLHELFCSTFPFQLQWVFVLFFLLHGVVACRARAHKKPTPFGLAERGSNMVAVGKGLCRHSAHIQCREWDRAEFWFPFFRPLRVLLIWAADQLLRGKGQIGRPWVGAAGFSLHWHFCTDAIKEPVWGGSNRDWCGWAAYTCGHCEPQSYWFLVPLLGVIFLPQAETAIV